MTKLQAKFESLKATGEKALVAFFTAGDQPLDELPAIVAALAEGGADAIEIGIPFSDPFGEGPTIQASSQRALDNGTTSIQILSAIGQVSTDVPLLVMGYYNPILRFGLSEFALASAKAGVSGSIVSDLVPDEAGDWFVASQAAGIDTVFLVAPTSTDKRISEVAEKTTGFVYAVSRTGVTGAENQMPPDIQILVQRISAKTEKPICVGFGISTPEHVRVVCQGADGAVVGSQIVQLLHNTWNGGQGKGELISYVKSLKEATRI